MIQELTIKIFKSSTGDGYYYDIFDTAQPDHEEAGSIDGGFCTTTMENAIDMACNQAQDLLKQ